MPGNRRLSIKLTGSINKSLWRLRAGCVLFGALLFAGFTPCSAQDAPAAPEWFYYQKSLAAFRGGDFGEALLQLKNLVDMYGETADSLHLRARIYEQEGELDLAERYFLDSLAKGGFETVDEKYTVNYRLANIYYQRKNYKKYEDTLKSVLSEQAVYTESRYSRMRDSYVSTLLERGIDSLALLYRVPFDFGQEAHRSLGVFYCRTGRQRTAVLHLAFANLAVISALSDELKERDPDYSFSTLDDTLERCAAYPQLLDFIIRGDFYRGLYFLASALNSEGASRQARAIWELTAKYAEGEWKTRSRSQLLEPRPEPLITY